MNILKDLLPSWSIALFRPFAIDRGLQMREGLISIARICQLINCGHCFTFVWPKAGFVLVVTLDFNFYPCALVLTGIDSCWREHLAAIGTWVLVSIPLDHSTRSTRTATETVIFVVSLGYEERDSLLCTHMDSDIDSHDSWCWFWISGSNRFDPFCDQCLDIFLCTFPTFYVKL